MLGIATPLDQAYYQAARGHADALAPMHPALGHPLEMLAVRCQMVGDDGREAAP